MTTKGEREEGVIPSDRGGGIERKRSDGGAEEKEK